MRCIIVDLFELGMQVVSDHGALVVAIALSVVGPLVLHVEREVVEAFGEELMLLCLSSESQDRYWQMLLPMV